MTKCGIICTCALMLIAMIALVIGSVRQEREGRRDAEGVGPCGRGRDAGTRLNAGPFGDAGTVAFRRGDERYVTCSAWDEPDDPLVLAACTAQEKERIRIYHRKELAYVLADKLLEAGGIRFTEADGKIMATLRAVAETPSTADSLSRCATAPSEREPGRERTPQAAGGGRI